MLGERVTGHTHMQEGVRVTHWNTAGEITGRQRIKNALRIKHTLLDLHRGYDLWHECVYMFCYVYMCVYCIINNVITM